MIDALRPGVKESGHDSRSMNAFGGNGVAFVSGLTDSSGPNTAAEFVSVRPRRSGSFSPETSSLWIIHAGRELYMGYARVLS